MVGLVAAWGRYPLVVADALRKRGKTVVALGIRDHTDPDIASRCDQYEELGLCQLGKAIRFFHRHGATTATMAGKIHEEVAS